MATNSIITKVTGTDSSSNRIASTFYGTCGTAAATAQKEVTLSDSCVFNDSCLVTGVTVHVKFTYSNSNGTPTLKVGTATAKQIMAYGTTKAGTTETNSWYAGAVVSFTYDGTYWVMNDYKKDTNTNTWRAVNVNGTQLLGTGTGTGAINFKSGTNTAVSGSGNDITISSTVNDATLTIQKNGSTVKTFTANASSNVTCNITVPTATSDLTNDSSFCAINDNASSSTSTFSSSKITDMLTPWYSFEYLDTSTNCANTTYVVKPPNIDVATAGVYLCVAHVHFKQNSNGIRELRIVQTRNDTQVGISTGTTGPASNVGEAALCESHIFTANAGDRFSLQLYQSSGGTLAATFRQLQVYRLSPTFMPAS